MRLEVLPLQQGSCPIERTEAHTLARESVRAALLAVDDAHRCTHDETGLAGGADRLEERAAGRDDVLDEQTVSPASNGPSMRFAVPYSFAASRIMRNGRPETSAADAARTTPPSAGGRAARRRARARRRSRRSARRSGRAGRDVSRSGTCRSRRTTACRAEDEVAFEVGGLDERVAELFVVHAPHRREHLPRQGKEPIGLASIPHVRHEGTVVEVDVEPAAPVRVPLLIRGADRDPTADDPRDTRTPRLTPPRPSLPSTSRRGSA